MKQIVIGGIIGSLSVISIVIWFSVLSDTQYEIVEKETIHPCQQVTIDYFDIFNKLVSFDRGSATLQEIISFNEEYGELVENKIEKFEENLSKYNCRDTTSEWFTDEFKAKLKFLIGNGFLP